MMAVILTTNTKYIFCNFHNESMGFKILLKMKDIDAHLN